MRNIEQRIINALRDQSEFKAGNTEVLNERSLDGKDIEGKVLLHGNLIATFNRSLNQLEIESGGWESVTTKSRLNALLSEFAPAYRIRQVKYHWYIDDLSQDEPDLLHWTSYAIFRAGTLKDFG